MHVGPDAEAWFMWMGRGRKGLLLCFLLVFLT